MASLQEALRALLAGDSALAAIAMGGVYDADTAGRDGLKLSDIQNADSTIKPAIFIRWTNTTPLGVYRAGTFEAFADVYFYEEIGYQNTQSMRNRAYQLLNRKKFSITQPTGWYVYGAIWTGDLTQQNDDSLAGASMERSSYLVDLRRT